MCLSASITLLPYVLVDRLHQLMSWGSSVKMLELKHWSQNFRVRPERSDFMRKLFLWVQDQVSQLTNQGQTECEGHMEHCIARLLTIPAQLAKHMRLGMFRIQRKRPNIIYNVQNQAQEIKRYIYCLEVSTRIKTLYILFTIKRQRQNVIYTV